MDWFYWERQVSRTGSTGIRRATIYHHQENSDLFYVYKKGRQRQIKTTRGHFLLLTSHFSPLGAIRLARAALWCHHPRGNAHWHQLLEEKLTGVWHPDQRDLRNRQRINNPDITTNTLTGSRTDIYTNNNINKSIKINTCTHNNWINTQTNARIEHH